MEKIAEKILFGGDYNPEQWEDEIRQADMELLPKAGVDIVTLNVFSWTLLQPNEDTYDFYELDKIVDMVSSKNMKICMATSTAAHPAWMAKKYPDILRVDSYGHRRKYGGRHNSCPNSPTFRKYAPRLARELAKHYKDNKNIVMWHISNEYGGECYCENCEKAYREWLRDKYGSLENLNYAWNCNFWSHKFLSWDEITLPSCLTECSEGGRSAQPGMVLDYKRFNSDSMLRNFTDERDEIKAEIPNAKVTTNFMETFKGLDYQKWAKEEDAVSFDSYPQQETEPAYVAFNHDLMRGLKNGESFMLMESTPSATSWRPVNTMKRPGDMRRWSYQAVAHGADTIMFFQMRQSPGGGEMFHGAIIDHSGRDDTRSFLEVSKLGDELKALKDFTLSAKTPARVALIFDWNCWWSLEEAAGVTYNLSYPQEVLNYYRAFYELNIPIDIISAEDDFAPYKMIVAPCMFMLKRNTDIRLKQFVRNGNTVILTTMSAVVAENNRAILGGFPGALVDMCGLWVEETNMLSEDSANSFEYKGSSYISDKLCDIIKTNNAISIGKYEKDYFAGSPAIVKNSYGDGNVYYIGVTSTPDFYREFVTNICRENDITDVLSCTPHNDMDANGHGLEITKRVKNNNEIYFIINHSCQNRPLIFPKDAIDLITGITYKSGDKTIVKHNDVLILKTH